MKFFKLLISICICLSAFFACGDDNITTSPFLDSAQLLPSLIKNKDSKAATEYFYDNQNRLIKRVYWSDYQNTMTLYVETVISYTDDGKINNITTTATDKSYPMPYIIDPIDFTYQGNKITYKSKHEGDKGSYTLNEKGLLIESEFQYGNNPEITIAEYDYDDNNNLKQCNESIAGNITTTTYEFDKQNGIFKNVNTPYWLLLYIEKRNYPCVFTYYLHMNNVTKEKYNGDACEILISYKYNESGFPISLKSSYNNCPVEDIAPSRSISEYTIDYIKAN